MNRLRAKSTRIVAAVTAALLVALCGPAGAAISRVGAAVSHAPASAEAGYTMPVSYQDTTTAAYQPWQAAVKADGSIEMWADFLSKTFTLPQDIPVIFAECGEENAAYDREKKHIEMCYELMPYLAKGLSPQNNDVPAAYKDARGATVAAFLHETGHAFIDLFKLPSTGREEDAADQFAVYVLLNTDSPYKEEAVVSAVKYFNLVATGQMPSDAQYANEHTIDQQRSYNLICWIYGSDPTKYAQWVGQGGLPQARADRCPTEYKQINESWTALLKDHFASS